MNNKYILCPKCDKTLLASHNYCVYCGTAIHNTFKYTGTSLTNLVEKALEELNEKGYNDPLYVQHNYEFTLTHDGLNKHRLFKGKNLRELYQKALMQAKTWDEMWNDKQAKESKKQEAEIKRLELEEKKHQARIIKERAEKKIRNRSGRLCKQQMHG
ncbi:MAG: hypothetical protein ACOZF2_04090 [Thermodesulfobacteriota bacterium]